MAWAILLSQMVHLFGRNVPPSVPVMYNHETWLSSLQAYLITFAPLIVATALIIFQRPKSRKSNKELIK